MSNASETVMQDKTSIKDTIKYTLASIFLVSLLVASYMLISGREVIQATIGDVQLHDVSAYSRSGHQDKVQTDRFIVGQEIYLGFGYDGAVADDYVQFEVLDSNDSIVYESELLRLDPGSQDLHQKIESKNLNRDTFRAVIKDKAGLQVDTFNFSVEGR